MGRWEPDARGRLAQAAMELYLEQGFDQTLVADIAARAGLTERTFFRHFADKREVLFDRSGALQDLLVGAVAEAPAAIAPMDAIAGALERGGELLGSRPDHSRRRHTVITANATLQERELIKMATLAAALAEALRARGVPDPAAALTAEAGIVVFKIAFERWVTDADPPSLPELMRSSMEELRKVV